MMSVYSANSKKINNDTIPDTGLPLSWDNSNFSLLDLLFYILDRDVFPLLGISVKTTIHELTECLSSSSWYSIQHCDEGTYFMDN